MDHIKGLTVIGKDNEVFHLCLMHWSYGGYTVQQWGTDKVPNYDARSKEKFSEVDYLVEERDYDREKDGLCGLNKLEKEIIAEREQADNQTNLTNRMLPLLRRE